MAFDFDAVSDLRNLHRTLVAPLDATPTQQLALRDQIVATMAALGVDVSRIAAATGDALAATPPATLLLWAVDEQHAIHAYAIPDEQVTPALREALLAGNFCFAGPDDCDEAGWPAALRLMAALDADGQGVDGLLDYPDYGHTLPPRAELEAIFGCWTGYHVADLADDKASLDWVNRRWSQAFAFNRAM